MKERKLLALAVGIACLLMSANTATAGKILPVPFFSQHGWDWGNVLVNPSAHPEGTCNEYMWDIGCAITSASMIFAAYGVTEAPTQNNPNHDPGQLNAWLPHFNWCGGGCCLDWEEASNYTHLDFTYHALSPSQCPGGEYLQKIREEIDDGHPVIGHVIYGTSGHFMVFIGYGGDGNEMTDLLFLDPWDDCPVIRTWPNGALSGPYELQPSNGLRIYKGDYVSAIA